MTTTRSHTRTGAQAVSSAAASTDGPADPTTARAPEQGGSRATRKLSARRLSALARAEWRQFRRNTTLIVLGGVFPLAFALGYYWLMDQQASQPGVAAGTAAGAFVVFTLIFVPFYSVLSMATTRRDEGVLMRLRTGQAGDAEILTAIAVPGAVMTIGLTPVFIGLVLAMGAQAALTLVPMAAAIILGLLICVALALLTSGFTRDAEAAQISSLPVMALAMVSLSPIRMLLPDRMVEVLNRTPFALMDDLAWLGWTGLTPDDAVAGRSALSATAALGRAWPMLGMLALWAAALLALVPRCMRWRTHR